MFKKKLRLAIEKSTSMVQLFERGKSKRNLMVQLHNGQLKPFQEVYKMVKRNQILSQRVLFKNSMRQIPLGQKLSKEQEANLLI